MGLHALRMQAIGRRLSARMLTLGAVAHLPRLHVPATSRCPPQQWPLNMTGLIHQLHKLTPGLSDRGETARSTCYL